MKDSTKQWLEFAKADIKSCKNNLEDDFLTNIVSFHSQQTVEKCFKAIYEENGINFPRVHNLMRLEVGITEFIPFDIDLDTLSTLDGVYISSRYPGNIGLLPDGKPSLEVSQKLYEFALSIFIKTLGIFGEE